MAETTSGELNTNSRVDGRDKNPVVKPTIPPVVEGDSQNMGLSPNTKPIEC